MSKQTLKIDLDAAELADLDAVAAAEGATREVLFNRIVREWLGPRRTAADRENHEAVRRLNILQRWWTARRIASDAGITIEAATKGFLVKLGDDQVSKRTLYLWEQQWRRAGLLGLVDKRRLDQRAKAPPPFAALLRKAWRSMRRPTMAAVYRNARDMAKAANVPALGERAARRHMQGWGTRRAGRTPATEPR